MRYPVSLIVANPAMEYIEESAISSFHSPPPSWERYADDIFTALPKNLALSFHQHLNTIEKTIKFYVLN